MTGASREDLLPAGIITIQAIMSLFNQTKTHVSVYGLREGVTIEATLLTKKANIAYPC
ncbi:hypothetical protein AGMMS49941_06110 [Deferribacterales bacterium]|nr:hypothetical protein AGMMS49941_06110 [Deferribacterales bacterium]